MMNRFAGSAVFGNKASTLAELEGTLLNGQVLPQECFSRTEWENNIGNCIDQILSRFGQDAVLIVRSAAANEDSDTASLAGQYESVARVIGAEMLSHALQVVFDSMGPDYKDEDHVFIQPMLENVDISGVLFTRDNTHGGYYYVLNYDDSSGRTDSVTAGDSNSLQTFYLSKGHCDVVPEKFRALISLAQELEARFSCDHLDIEFAIKDGVCTLLQVRRLILPVEADWTLEEQNQALDRIKQTVGRLSGPHPYLCGRRSVFGVMPDWNPAEIIGVRPRPLALTTYKNLVTDNVWAYQRSNYGYKNLRSFPLLIDFEGLPYIDVRLSFNSFIPADVEDNLANRLVDYYIDRLTSMPALHDKVEFEIILSCYTLDISKRLEPLKQNGFSEEECQHFSEHLRKLTNHIIHNTGLWRQDRAKIDKLLERQQVIADSDLSDLDRVYWLLEDCKRYGTLPFAGLARAGFIAVQMMQSLLQQNIINREEYTAFFASVETVSSQMAKDFERLSKTAFLAQYGHLRPGTYDINSPRYDEAPDLYFKWDQTAERSTNMRPFSLTIDQMNHLETALKEHRLEHGALSLLNFIRHAIEGREYSKFVFSASLSEALRLIEKLGAAYGFSKDDLSYVDIEMIGKLYGSSSDPGKILEASIASGKEKFRITRHVNLPPLISTPDDGFGYYLGGDSPNYITQSEVVAPVVSPTGETLDNLTGKIVLIEKADPGFDWLFSHDIAGLVTKFGGVNSHMAIRAGELGIPAVIGAGESLYRYCIQADILKLDCENKTVMRLR